ncbi:MAG: hypothetical protein KR126chlam6_01405 [Candidatus Anoxychlamydiales bacterium]|nr:hypothetical protein [Candidatus Anoxychlamydiales bacterium]
MIRLVLIIIFCLFSKVVFAETIAIFTHKIDCLGPWDPDNVKTGLPGSEEAVVNMAEELANLGYQVIVFGNPPISSNYSSTDLNPCYIDCDLDDGQYVDIAISWRKPEIGRDLKKRASRVYLWLHDIARKTFSEEDLSFYDDVLWLSQWQKEQWISVSPAFAKFTNIYGNAINPKQFESIPERENPYSCIYGSNCNRGVEVLLEIWPEIKRQFPRATLDIYYGWPKWGRGDSKKEKYLQKLTQDLQILGVNQHGFVGQEELNQAYAKASLWTYPCLVEETFCITGLRAQMAGAIPVIIDEYALKETVRYGYKCKNRKDYFQTLINAMEDIESITLEKRQKIRDFILLEFTWKRIAQQWDKQFKLDVVKIQNKDFSADLIGSQ